MAINLDGVIYSMRAEIPAMLASGGGSIVNIGSILSWVGFARSGAHVAAKHGLVGLTKTTALEYATDGIRVNAIGWAAANPTRSPPRATAAVASGCGGVPRLRRRYPNIKHNAPAQQPHRRDLTSARVAKAGIQPHGNARIFNGEC